MIRKITDYVNGVQLEMKKVTWLSKEEMLGSTMIVGIFAVFIAVFLFFVDFGLSEFVSKLLGGTLKLFELQGSKWLVGNERQRGSVSVGVSV